MPIGRHVNLETTTNGFILRWRQMVPSEESNFASLIAGPMLEEVWTFEMARKSPGKLIEKMIEVSGYDNGNGDKDGE